MRLSILSKVTIIGLILLIVPSITIGITSYLTAKSGLDDLGEAILENSVNASLQLIESLQHQVEAGSITLEQAQEKFKIYILGPKNEEGKRPINKDIYLGENGYLFVISKDATQLAHPSIEGTNHWDTKGPDGVYFTREMVNAGLNGGGYTYYDWALPNHPDVIKPKIAYSKADPYWGWIIVAGTYMMDFNEGSNHLLLMLAITLGIATLFGIAITFIFAKSISKPLVQLASHVKRVATGDLTVEPITIKNKDEIGELNTHFNTMVVDLRDLVTQVSDSTQHVAATAEELNASTEQSSKATEQIAISTQELASGSERQQSSTEQTVEVVNEITKGIEHIAKSVQSVSESAAQSSDSANNGNKVVSEALSSMKNIQANIVESAKVVNILGEKSNEIGNIISMITDIAAQTNLLALNAAIEAARAGEHGRGFSVVADEVRKLAEQSSHAAGQINELIDEIQEEIEQAVNSMSMSTSAFTGGLQTFEQAGAAFGDIYTSVEGVKGQFEEVSSSVQQIYAGTHNLVRLMDEIENITRNSTGNTQTVAAAAEEQLASMEEITSSSNSLASMAEELQDQISRFKI